jgi:hypothetical protein
MVFDYFHCPICYCKHERHRPQVLLIDDMEGWTTAGIQKMTCPECLAIFQFYKEPKKGDNTT